MLGYAYHHGVKVLFLENPETLVTSRHYGQRRAEEEVTTTIIEPKSLEIE